MNVSPISDDDQREQQIAQLNKEIELGLKQLKAGEKVSAAESYQRLKKKISDLKRK